MIPHDAALDTAYGTSAWAPYTRITLVSPTAAGGETQVVADGVDGMFTMSDTSWPRSSCELTVPAGVTATDTVRPVSPYGGRVVIEMGATIGGSRYVFQVADLDVAEVFLERPTNAWTIRAVSQEARVNEASPILPPALYDYATLGTGSGTFSNAVRALVSEVMPGYNSLWNLYPVSVSLGSDPVMAGSDEYVADDSLWTMIEEAVDAIGAEAYFRYDRRLVIRTDPVIGSPVQTLKVGAGGTITDYRDVSRWAYNAVYIRYTRRSDGAMLFGTWENASPGSPTRITGPYGKHARIESKTVTTIPTQARADARAASIAKRAGAPFRRLELDAVPAPWLEPGDTVAVQLVEGGTTNMLVSGVRIPLSQLEPMTVTMHDSAGT
jgi:hypothetical protein